MVIQTLVHGAILRWLRTPADFPLATRGAAAVQVFFATLRKNWEQTG